MTRGKAVTKKGGKVPAAKADGPNSAEEQLLESFGQLIDEAAERMTAEEFAEAAKRANATLDRAIAAHSRRRGIA